ncbi:MAG: M20/M25/M40 family metallo-hydrolase, partial [Rubrivivax sp.]
MNSPPALGRSAQDRCALNRRGALRGLGRGMALACGAFAGPWSGSLSETFSESSSGPFSGSIARAQGAPALADVPPATGADPAAFNADDLAHAAALRDRALGDGLAWRLVESLCTEIGPRPAGSEADARAVAWALDHARRLEFDRAWADPVPLRIWQRGPGSAELTAPHRRRLVMVALGNSAATPPEGLEAELVVYPDLAALRADESSRARGRIVFIDQKMERTVDGSGYGAAVPARVMGPVEAARKGAVALVLRSIGTDRDRVAHTGAMSVDPRVPPLPAAALSAPDADVLARLHAAGQPLRLRLVVQAVSGVEALTHNVIAELRGSEQPEEVVLLGAHLDSWDVGQGALDDGAGVAIVMAAAQQIVQFARRPRRTVRVVLFGNEENGFDGARDYGTRYADVRHQLIGESDFGAGRVWRLRSRVNPQALPAFAAMAALLAPLGVQPGDNQGNPGPDAALLMRRHRWPGVELSQDGTNYFDVHHTDNDTLDRIDP